MSASDRFPDALDCTVRRRAFLAQLAAPLAALAAAAVRLPAQPRPLSLPELQVYKDPNCGCCAAWVTHVRAAGFRAVVHDTADMDGVKANFGIPAALHSCHTARLGKWLVEGHVPADLLKRLAGHARGIPGDGGAESRALRHPAVRRRGAHPGVRHPRMTVPFPGPAAAVEPAQAADIPAMVALNNLFAPDGLTLTRSPAFVAGHLADYQVIRGADGRVIGQVALDDYSPSLVELVSLAVAPDHQGRGLGQVLVAAAEALARRRGYPELFAISLAEALFLRMGFTESSIAVYPEKIARYRGISRSELSIGRKFCFAKRLTAPAAAAH
jgi:amino-acid N-acetyltransferase